MLRSIRFYLLFAFAMTVWLWSAWLLWQNDALSEEIVAGKVKIDSLQALKALPPLIAAPLAETLFLNSQRADADNALMITVAEEYQRRRPLDPRGWLWASEFHQRSGENVLAAENLKTAHLLSRTNSPLLMKVFNRYLALGMTAEAMPVARDLVFANPGSFRKIFYLLTRLNTDYAAVVGEVIPTAVPDAVGGRPDYDPGIYYQWALTDAIRAKNQDLANAVWQVVPEELRLNSNFGLAYLKYLVAQQNREAMRHVWLGLTGSPVNINQIAEANFETAINAVSPCWDARKADGAAWSLDSNAFEGEHSLMVEFNGDQNINYYHLSCFVPIESGKSYKLTGMWAGKGISTLSGPFVDVYAPGVKGFYKRSEPMIGTWPWTVFDFDFTVPEDVEIIELRIRRWKTDLLDSKISGRVWFDNFDLVQLSPETGKVSSAPAVTFSLAAAQRKI